MPDEIAFNTDLIIGIVASLCVIIGILITALASMYTRLIRNDIRSLHGEIANVSRSVNHSHDRITEHVEQFHAVKP